MRPLLFGVTIPLVAFVCALTIGSTLGPAPVQAHGGGKDKYGCHRQGAERHCHITVSEDNRNLRMEIERLRKAIERMGRQPADRGATGAERACRELYKQFDRENRANDHKPVYSAVRAKCWIGVKPGEAR